MSNFLFPFYALVVLVSSPFQIELLLRKDRATKIGKGLEAKRY